MSKLLKGFVAPSAEFSCNVQTFRDQYVSLSDKVVELERVSYGIGMVPQTGLNGDRGEMTAL